MLSVDDIKDLAEKNNMQISFQWDKNHSGPTPPKLEGIRLFFMKKAPEAWAKLLMDLSEVPVSISGTRMSTGSGATDGTFYPEYAQLLPAINVRRAEIGLDPVRN